MTRDYHLTVTSIYNPSENKCPNNSGNIGKNGYALPITKKIKLSFYNTQIVLNHEYDNSYVFEYKFEYKNSELMNITFILIDEESDMEKVRAEQLKILKEKIHDLELMNIELNIKNTDILSKISNGELLTIEMQKEFNDNSNKILMNTSELSQIKKTTYEFVYTKTTKEYNIILQLGKKKYVNSLPNQKNPFELLLTEETTYQEDKTIVCERKNHQGVFAITSAELN